MVSSILPVYFVFYLHFSPLAFGFLDGISQGAAVALLSLASGIFADRWRRQREVATVGYAISAFSRIGLLLAGATWPFIVGILAVERVGKGIRTAPRDAMISLASSRERLATAFAVHRALDTCGAVLGPLVAFLILRISPRGFDLVLVASFCIGLVGLGVIGLLLETPRVPVQGSLLKRQSLRCSLRLFRERPFRSVVLCGGLLSLCTASDAFLYLMLQKKTGWSPAYIPLLAFSTAAVYLLFSVPAGRIADGWGRSKVFLIGYSLLALAYGTLLLNTDGIYIALLLIGCLGAYYAATDGVLAAIASSWVPPELRTSGLALLNTTNSFAKLASSVAFGAVWASGAAASSVWVFLGGLTVAIVFATRALPGAKLNDPIPEP
jgi:MFS family permease